MRFSVQEENLKLRVFARPAFEYGSFIVTDSILGRFVVDRVELEFVSIRNILDIQRDDLMVEDRMVESIDFDAGEFYFKDGRATALYERPALRIARVINIEGNFVQEVVPVTSFNV